MKILISKSAEKVIYAVIVLNIIAMVVESEPDLPLQFRNYLGYFEIFSIALGGKIFGTIISLVGVGVVAVPTGIISASFVEVINEN